MTAPAMPVSAPAPAGNNPNPISAMIGVLTKPGDFYASIKGATGFGAPIIFAVIMGLLAGVLTAVKAFMFGASVGGALGGGMGMLAGIGAIIIYPIACIIGVFIGGAIVHVIALICSGKGSYEASCRVAAYGLATMPLNAAIGFIPMVGGWISILVSLYGLFIFYNGLVKLHDAKASVVMIICGIFALIVVASGVWGQIQLMRLKSLGNDFQQGMMKGLNDPKAQEELNKAMKDFQKEMEKAAKEAEKKQ